MKNIILIAILIINGLVIANSVSLLRETKDDASTINPLECGQRYSMITNNRVPHRVMGGKVAALGD